MPETPETNEPIQYGPTRALVILNEYHPPAIVMLDIDGQAVATPGVSRARFEAIRLGLASALGPYRTNPSVDESAVPDDAKPTQGLPRHPSDDENREVSQERGKSKSKGKGKKKGHDKDKGKPDWAGNPDHPDHPRNRKPKDDRPEDEPQPEPEPEIPVDNVPADSIPTEEEVAAALAGLDLDAAPSPGDSNLEKSVVVNAAVTIDPAAFADWYAEYHPGADDVPDPALHPSLVADFLADTR